MVPKRELAAAVGIPIVLAVLLFTPAIVFDLLVAVIALAALWEFYRLAEKAGHPVSKTVGLGAGGLVLLGVALSLQFLHGLSPSFALPAVFALLLLLFLASLAPLVSEVAPSVALASAASTAFGVLSVALPAASLPLLRDFSPRAVVFLLLIVWGCDSFAYYTGRSLGRHRLAPVVSPGKTWEGAIGGLVGATLIGAAAGAWEVMPQFGPVRGALAGALASTAGQIGDLVESMWKRGAGVKDSGVFLPGHGGFYDRIDSLLYAGPVLAAFVASL